MLVGGIAIVFIQHNDLGPSKLLNVPIICSVLLLNRIPWYEYTTVCLTIYLLMTFWVFLIFGYYKDALNILIQNFLWT